MASLNMISAGSDWLSGVFIYSGDEPMLFTRLYFWGFLFLLLLFYALVYRRSSFRNAYLLVMSLFFYYKSGGYFFSLLVFSTIADYALGHLIYRSKTAGGKKLFLSTSVFINLGLLAYFKYAYFLTGIFNNITGSNSDVVNFPALFYNNITGASADISVIILPIGISFFTFQTISYTVDVYREKLKPVDSITDFGFYVSFFPQLVAGPIVRAAEFMPQLYSRFKLTVREMGHAIFLIISGLVKKMVISDYISANFVDRVFDNPLSFTGFENLMAVYGYSVQIYCDFSGYTDIAIGVALLLGFRLPVNFNSPYKAVNIADFWRRWHISLSSWLRDYLYIPIGGSRKGGIRTFANLMITMLLGGLWHGASMKFMVWGGLHGVALAGHKIFRKIFPGSGKVQKPPAGIYRFISIFATFNFVSLTWLCFRSETLQDMNDMIHRILYSFGGEYIPGIMAAYGKVFSLMFLALFIHWLPAGLKEDIRGIFIRSSSMIKIFIIVTTVFIIYQVKSAGIQPFIYFQF